MKKACFALLALAVLGAACTTDTSTTTTSPSGVTPTPTTSTTPRVASGPTPVIVDYSPTVSDVAGLMYLLSHPGVEVIAISLPVTGEAGCDLGIEVTMGILAMLDRGHVPVACDPDVPPDAKNWPEEFLEKQENLAFGLPEPEGDPYPGVASDLIAEATLSAGQPVTIYAVAPLTNVARAFDDHPEIVGNVEAIVIMGGAVDVPGNTFSGHAEWNIFIDSGAALAVLESGAPVTLVSLDATNDVPVPDWYATALSRVEQSDQIAYLGRLVRIFPAVTSGFFYLWDELAAVVVTENVEITTAKAGLTVIVQGAESGRTVRDPDGSTATFTTGVVSPDAFYEELLSRLAGAPIGFGGATVAEAEYLTEVAASLDDFAAALEVLFANPLFDPDADYDGQTVADGIDLIITTFSTSLEIVDALDPPDSLSELHDAYIDELRTIVEQRQAIISTLRAANTWEEAFPAFAILADDDACFAMANEAFFLGVEAEFVCSP